MSKLTLDEFREASPADWRAQAEATLDGASIEKKLFTRTDEGIAIAPIYDIGKGIEAADSYPGSNPFVRGIHAAPAPWEIAQRIACSDPKSFNDALRKSIECGQTALNVRLAEMRRKEAGALVIASADDFGIALDGIDLSKTPFYFQVESTGFAAFALLIADLRRRGIPLATLRGAFEQDPLAEIITSASLPHSLKTSFHQMALIARWAGERIPNLRTIGIRTFAYHEAGGTAVHELAFAMATAVEYCRQMAARGLAIDQTAPQLRFSFAAGGDFFMSIAKFRAARLLWARIVEACGGDIDSRRMQIHARTSIHDKSVLDAYVNVLRDTTEACAAVVGGCQSIEVGAFDEVSGMPDEGSQRLARNLQIILRDECSFDRVIDPAGGSPYVETLTRELAEKSWRLFQEVEKRGGMCEALKAGYPQELVNATAAAKTEAVECRRTKLIGVNVYANPADGIRRTAAPESTNIERSRTGSDAPDTSSELSRMRSLFDAGSIEAVDAAITAAANGVTLGQLAAALNVRNENAFTVVPLPARRAAAPFEELRLAAAAVRPKVFLAKMGAPAQYRARAEFATGFFQAGGFEVIDGKGTTSIEELATAATEITARIIVICSSDASYPEFVPALVGAIKGAAPDKIVVLAGFPIDYVDAFKAVGVDEFIHLRANCYRVLRHLLTTAGVSL